MPLFIIFIVIPLIEIALFVTVGERIGIFATLFLCLVTAMIGAALIRQQGLATLFSARRAMEQGEMPLREIFDGFCLAIAGASLITPGFFTDTIGFLLLIPAVRSWLLHILPRFFDVEAVGMSASQTRRARDPYVIDAEFEVLDDEDENSDKP